MWCQFGHVTPYNSGGAKPAYSDVWILYSQRVKVGRAGGFRVEDLHNYFAEMRSGSEEGSYLGLIDLCMTQL